MAKSISQHNESQESTCDITTNPPKSVNNNVLKLEEINDFHLKLDPNKYNLSNVYYSTIQHLNTKIDEIIGDKMNILTALEKKGTLIQNNINTIRNCLYPNEKGRSTILNNEAEKIVNDAIKRTKEDMSTKYILKNLKNNTIKNTKEYETFKKIWDNGKIDRNTLLKTNQTPLDLATELGLLDIVEKMERKTMPGCCSAYIDLLARAAGQPINRQVAKTAPKKRSNMELVYIG